MASTRRRGRSPQVNSKLLTHYVEYLRRDQCVAQATLVIRRNFVAPFLDSIGELAMPSRLHRMSAKAIHDYVITKSPPLHRASKKHLTSSLRSFLRFAHVKGYLKRPLMNAVPVIATRKLDRLPRGMPWKSVQALLRAPDRRTPPGRRDYAMLLLLATYGVRIGQVTTLRLKDIHWADGTIDFRASKGGKPLHLPLHASVANALLDYIERDRGRLTFAEVFLTQPPNPHPFALNNHFGANLARYCRLAGLDRSLGGRSHAIRHAFATRLMEQGTPIKTIADLLGHRSIENTFLYTKVDLPRLRRLARAWPQAQP
jgi:site-specific recombinase XerD